MSLKDKAKEIRKALKAKGWNARSVSVRCSGGNAIYVTIKDAAVPIHLVEAIANRHEKIDRCHVSFEILSGGNTFVFVEYEYGLISAKAAEVAPLLSDEPGRSVEVDGLEIWRESHGRGYSIARVGDNLHPNLRCHDKRSAAASLARVLMDGGFEAYGEWKAVAS